MTRPKLHYRIDYCHPEEGWVVCFDWRGMPVSREVAEARLRKTAKYYTYMYGFSTRLVRVDTGEVEAYG